jgi:hypothetical protein
MGAYAPVPESIASAEQIARVVSEVAQPTIDGMAADGTPYHGLLYCQVSMAMAGQGLDVLSRRGRVHALLEWRENGRWHAVWLYACLENVLVLARSYTLVARVAAIGDADPYRTKGGRV